MKQRIITLFAVLLTALGVSAESFQTVTSYDFVYGGLFYNIISGGNAVSVTHEKEYRHIDDWGYVTETSPISNYSGDIIIPTSVFYEGKTYPVTTIGEGAFHICKSLTSVEIPNSVTSIGVSAFHDCSSLTSAVIPNSVTTIDYHTFSGCSSLVSVVIPNSVTLIGTEAFYRCSSLTGITSLNTTPPSVGLRCFDSVPTSTCVLKVPAEAVDAYKEAKEWKNFANIEGIERESIYGDMNGDGKVDIFDVTTLIEYILNK